MIFFYYKIRNFYLSFVQIIDCHNKYIALRIKLNSMYSCYFRLDEINFIDY